MSPMCLAERYAYIIVESVLQGGVDIDKNVIIVKTCNESDLKGDCLWAKNTGM
jgi:hypothetical protein